MKIVFANNKGFMWVEVMVSLFIVTMLMMIVANSLLILEKNSEEAEYQMEATLAAQQMKADVYSANNININEQELILTTPRGLIRYYQDGDKLIRTVNGQGYEIILRDISNVEFNRDHQKLFMKVTFDNSEDYVLFLGDYV